MSQLFIPVCVKITKTQAPDGCLSREECVKMLKADGMYAGKWVRVTKVIRDVGGGELMEREVYKEYGSFEEVGVLGDYSMADEMGAYELTSEVTRDDHPIGGSSYPGVYELQQELHRCSEEEMNMALAVEDTDGARKDKDQDDDDALQEKQVKKRPHSEKENVMENSSSLKRMNCRSFENVEDDPIEVQRPHHKENMKIMKLCDDHKENMKIMANVMENVEDDPIEESDEDSQVTLIPGGGLP